MKKKETCTCPYCGQKIGERQITLYSGMVSLLWSIFDHCFNEGTNEITRKEIKPFIKNENDTARLGDWRHFGGLVKKEGKGVYKLDMKKCRDFFTGKLTIPTVVWKTAGMDEIECECFKTINEIKSLEKFLDDNGKFIAIYRVPKIRF
jgi:hypothetical protein